MLSRRGFGVLAGGALLSGCASTAAVPVPLATGFTEPLPPRGTRLKLAPVHVAPDRVIRVVAGLRPYRPAGFVVRSEPLGDKRLVHNYGHGGGGITLSWGSSDLAVRQGFDSAVSRYAVIGCGVMGLSTARLLQRRGGEVTIYARDLPPETTSNIAGGQWWPASVFDSDVATEAFRAQHDEAARLAYRHFQPLTGEHYGVRWIRNYHVQDRPFRRPVSSDPLRDVAPEYRDLEPGEHPFTGQHVRQIDSLMIEPAVYLQAVMEDFLTAGGRIVVRTFPDMASVAALPEPVVFNCTGLGARELVGDQELYPVKGQLVVLLPQPEVTYNLLSGGLYMFPRRDGIVLGGTFEHRQWDPTPRPEATASLLAKHEALFAALRA